MPPTGPPLPFGELAREFLFTVPVDQDGDRLDEVLSRMLGVGRRAAARLATRARRNDRRCAKGDRVAAGDILRILPAGAPEDPSGAEPVLVRASARVLVLGKPAGLPTVAHAGSEKSSLAGWIAHHHPECAGVGRPGECGLVQRLDTGTSGLLLAARDPVSHHDLRDQFTGHGIEKEYLALVDGELTRAVSVDVPLGQHPKSRRRMRAVHGDAAIRRYAASPARTDLVPVRGFPGRTLVRATTRTGIRHQVRVHLAHAGHPLCGDSLYGGSPLDGGGDFLLHAEWMRWIDPEGGEPREERLAPPESWSRILERIVRHAPD